VKKDRAFCGKFNTPVCPYNKMFDVGANLCVRPCEALEPRPDRFLKPVRSKNAKKGILSI